MRHRTIFAVLVTVSAGVSATAHAQVYDTAPPESQVVAGRRAAEVVGGPLEELLQRYPEAAEFPYSGTRPFGTLHPEAPPETAQFGQLAGLWYIENHSLFQGQWYCCWNAAWGFRYVIDGFAVQDLWVQHQSDLPPTATVERTLSLTQLRVFRPSSAEWFIAFVTGAGASGGSNSGMFTARQVGDELVMTRDNDPGYQGPPDRIVFFGIEQDRWRWRRDVVNEQGEWQTTGFIEAHRLRWPVEREPR